MVRRLPLLLVLAVLGAPGLAASQDRPGLYLDPQQLPPDTRPGECVTRKVTGPGGAYRWERIECEHHEGWSDFDRWGYGRAPLRVQDAPLRGDRYGGWSDDRAYDRQPYDDGYAAPYPTYRVAGRDADGYLVWPGKLP